mgnify:CR=1 FL=1|jgi:hypothetical protein
MTWVALIVGVVSFALKIWALVDCFGHPDTAFRAADRLTRTLWIVILAAALALHLWVGGLAWGGVAGTVVALVYLLDVRPRVRAHEHDPA